MATKTGREGGRKKRMTLQEAIAGSADIGAPQMRNGRDVRTVTKIKRSEAALREDRQRVVDFATRRDRECTDLRASMSSLKVEAARKDKELEGLRAELLTAQSNLEESNAKWQGELNSGLESLQAEMNAEKRNFETRISNLEKVIEQHNLNAITGEPLQIDSLVQERRAHLAERMTALQSSMAAQRQQLEQGIALIQGLTVTETEIECY